VYEGGFKGVVRGAEGVERGAKDKIALPQRGKMRKLRARPCEIPHVDSRKPQRGDVNQTG
jgi:hypothetical protein